MPSMDRKWRLIQSIGHGIRACSALYLVALIILALRMWEMPSLEQAQLYWYCLVGIWQGAVFVETAKQSRERERLRALALAGDTRAMPPAAIKPPLASPADASHQPLMLLWRPARIPWLLMIILLFMVIALTWGLFLLLALVISPTYSMLLIACGAAFVALEIGWFVWWQARRRRSSNGVVVTGEGIRRLQPRKADIFIPWDEARLFEVWRMSVGVNHFSGYALTSARALVEWREYTPNNAPAAADGASYEEMQRRSQAIVQTIIARSGLIPRTCEPTQALKEEAGAAHNISSATHASGWRRLSLVGVTMILTFAFSPLVAAVGALVAPLTTSQPLNIYVAVTMGAVSLALLTIEGQAIAWTVRTQSLLNSLRPDIQLPSPPPNVGQLSLRTPHIWRNRVITSGVGLLTIGDIYTLIRGSLDFPHVFDHSVP